MDRKAQAIARKAQEKIDARNKELEYWNNLTDEEIEAIRKKELVRAKSRSLLSAWCGVGTVFDYVPSPKVKPSDRTADYKSYKINR